jgi:hypothetical protein
MGTDNPIQEAYYDKRDRDRFLGTKFGTEPIYSPAVYRSNEPAFLQDTASLKPVGKIEGWWIEHNVYEEGQKGMRIHVNFSVQNMKDQTGYIGVYYYFQDGKPLKDHNRKYCTRDGHVSVAQGFTPEEESDRGDDWKLFMPYGEFHLEGGESVYPLQCNVSLFDQHDRELVRTLYYLFDLYLSA